MIFIENNLVVEYPCDNRHYLNEGEEVVVYLVDNRVIKVNKDIVNKATLDKKTSMTFEKIKTKLFLLPHTTLLSEEGEMLGYTMPYIEDLGIENLYYLDKNTLSQVMKIVYDDIVLLSDNKVVIDDLHRNNVVYHDSIYLVDPGSYKISYDKDENQCYGINIDRFNEYLIDGVIRTCCHSFTNDPYEISKIIKMVRKQAESKNMDILSYFINGIDYPNIMDMVSHKFQDLKYTVHVNNKKVYLRGDCTKVYESPKKDIYAYKQKKKEKQLYIYKDSDSFNLSPQELEHLRAIETSRILLPIDRVDVDKEGYVGFTVSSKRNNDSDFSKASGSFLSQELDHLLSDITTLSKNGVFIGDISIDDIIYDNGIYIKNLESLEICDNKEEALSKNLNVLNKFVLSLIEEELICKCSYTKAMQVLNSIKEETIYYVGNTIYQELYKSKNLSDCAKKLVKLKAN